MTRTRSFLGHVVVGGMTLFVVSATAPMFIANASAAVPVEDRSSTGVAPRPRLEPVPPSEPESPPRDWSSVPDSAPPSGDMVGSGSGLGQLFTELQTLRNEVQELRSMVEEQQHKLRQLEAAQQEQYQNLDERILALSGQGVAPTTGGGAQLDRPVNANSRPVLPTNGSNGGGATRNAAGEKAAYQTAFDSMKARAFDQSIEKFTRLIQDYPDGEMTPGSWYWLGELYLAKADLNQSRESFSQVVNLYPSHNKAPDALYKMGVVFHRLGDNSKALEYLDRVQRDFPVSAAAGLARIYASELR